MTIEGGKYTTSRALAENAIDKAFKMMNKKSKPSISTKQFLEGSHIEDFMQFVAQNKEKYPFLNDRQVLFLSRMYGTELEEIMKLAKENKDYQEFLNEDGETLSQVVYAFRNESANSLLDVLIRRTGIGQLGDIGDELLSKIAKIAQEELNWDEEKTQEEINIAKERMQLPE